MEDYPILENIEFATTYFDAQACDNRNTEDRHRERQMTEYPNKQRKANKTKDPIPVKIVLFDDETRTKLRQGISDVINDYCNGFITFGIWGGLIGYWIGCYYN